MVSVLRVGTEKCHPLICEQVAFMATWMGTFSSAPPTGQRVLTHPGYSVKKEKPKKDILKAKKGFKAKFKYWENEKHRVRQRE